MSRFERCALYVCMIAVAALAVTRGPWDARASAQSGAAADVSPRIAVCAVIRITDELMDTDRFKPGRTALEEELRRDKLQPLLDEGRELLARIQGMQADDADRAAAVDRYRRLQAEAQRATSEIVQAVEKKVAEQLTEAYEMVRAAAVDIAEEKGFNYVLASTGGDDQLKPDSVMRLVRDFLGRPVIMAPESVDITEDVRADLNLD